MVHVGGDKGVNSKRQDHWDPPGGWPPCTDIILPVLLAVKPCLIDCKLSLMGFFSRELYSIEENLAKVLSTAPGHCVPVLSVVCVSQRS